MIIQEGICDCCNVTRIIERVGKRLKATREYTEITLIFSDGSIGQHGLCRKCKENFTDADSVRVTQNIVDTWKQDLRDTGEKQLQRIDTIKSDGWAHDEQTAKEKPPHLVKEKHKDRLVKEEKRRDNNKEDK